MMSAWNERSSRAICGVVGTLMALATFAAAVGQEVPLLPPPSVISNADGRLISPLTVLFGTVDVPGPGSDTAVNVRAYGLLPPDRNDPAKTKPLIPGPTFVFHPGDLVRIHLHNYLNRASNPALNLFEDQPQQTAPGTADDINQHVAHEISIPNNADITNLHVHGLHVDPKQDNVTLLVLPEDTNPSDLAPSMQRLVPTINRWWTRPYEYKIPPDHLPGTFWYHSHKHGSTATQVENGMAGTLLMLPNDDADSIVPGLWNSNPNKTHDRVLVIQGIMNVGTPQGKGKGPFKNESLGNPVLTVNGRYRPTLQLPAGQLERWRFVMAGANHQAFSRIWVGKVALNLPGQLQDALNGITNQKDANKYLPPQGTMKFPNTPAVVTCINVPGRVKLVAVDGVPMWQAVDISPTSPTFGAAGNRNDLLIQLDEKAESSGPYYVYQNLPLLIDDLAAAYPKLFSPPNGAAAQARYAALTGGTMQNGNAPFTFVNEAGQTLPNSLTTDPYSLGTNYTGLSVQWPQVNEEGQPSSFGAMPIGPLLKGVANKATNGVDINIRAQQLSDGPGWQPMPDAAGGGTITGNILFALKICGTAEGPKMPSDAALNARLSQLSPATHQPDKSILKRLNKHGQLVPGIPSYVSPLPDTFDGHQVVVFDRGQFTFDYTNMSDGTTLQFRQFWINGRQFSPNDFVGNPFAQQLIQTPIVNVEPQLGSYSPNAARNAWTHQHGSGIGAKLLVTNPGYFLPLKALGKNQYNYDYPPAAQFQPPTYKDVTGLVAPKQSQSTTAEEWLLVNNSDLFHPFHIHISPFFVEEVGQLNYDKTKAPGSQWTLKSLSDKDSTSPFKWIAGNWWDVILMPPHGYVKMKTWMNFPVQQPENGNDPRSDLFVIENANGFGSWVLHCHILRHEDRGMMTMVNTKPKPASLAGKWFASAGPAMQIIDVNGSLKVTGIPGTTVTGNFSQGLGNPFATLPWAGAMSFVANNVTTTKTFNVTDDVAEIVFSDGTRWTKTQQPLTPAVVPINLTGDWADSDNNVASIKQDMTPVTGPGPVTSVYDLTFTPKTSGAMPPVWWGTGKGSWPGGVIPPTVKPPKQQQPQSLSFAGTQTLVNNAGRNQQLSFCVTADGNSIVFGNGIKWTRKK